MCVLRFLLRPLALFPANGLCMSGIANQWLTTTFGPEFSFYSTAVSFCGIVINCYTQGPFIYVTSINVGAFTNTAIHRFVQITKLLHPLPFFLETKYLNFIFVFIQFIWPGVAILFITRIPFRSEHAYNANVKVRKAVFEKVDKHEGK